MINISFSDAEAYAVSIALSKYIAEHRGKDTRAIDDLVNISNMLFDHSYEILHSLDRKSIEKDIGYKDR